MSKDDCHSYYPNDTLAAVIVQAWSDQAFKARLLSGAKLANQASSKTVLEEAGISLNDVVVLTEAEFAGFTPTKGQTVFVLPDPRGKYTMEVARIAMASTCCGI
jgi:hypothetical protein